MKMLFVWVQRLLPKHLLSRLLGRVARSRRPWIKNFFIQAFCFFFPVDLEEAERTDKSVYTSFNDFFTRSLKPGTRPLSGSISSPADGTVSTIGNLTHNTLIQSKGVSYSLAKLLASDTGRDFSRGSFISIYLAPHNYHRVHMPMEGELLKAKYVPGNLFSVNDATASHQPDLFAGNERLVMRFTTGTGPLACVMVGAMLVAGIRPVWLDRSYRPRLQVETLMRRRFAQGDELGQFEMGSTVILIFDHRVDFCVKEGDAVKVGQPVELPDGPMVV